jgi:quercetin dioxygenase-like cupin family protein
MATHHAAPGEVVNLASWAEDLPAEHSKIIARTEAMELARLVLAPGEVIGKHHINGPLVVQCLAGDIEILALAVTRNVNAGEMLYLPPGEKFTLKARSQSLVLITFVFVHK